MRPCKSGRLLNIIADIPLFLVAPESVANRQNLPALSRDCEHDPAPSPGATQSHCHPKGRKAGFAMLRIIALCVFAIFVSVYIGSSQEATGSQLEGLTGIDKSARQLATIHNPNDPRKPRINRRFKQLLGWISKPCKYSHSETGDKVVVVWQGMKKAGVRGESLLDTTEQVHSIISGMELAYRQYAPGTEFPPSVCQDAMVMYWSLPKKEIEEEVRIPTTPEKLAKALGRKVRIKYED